MTISGCRPAGEKKGEPWTAVNLPLAWSTEKTDVSSGASSLPTCTNRPSRSTAIAYGDGLASNGEPSTGASAPVFASIAYASSATFELRTAYRKRPDGSIAEIDGHRVGPAPVDGSARERAERTGVRVDGEARHEAARAVDEPAVRIEREGPSVHGRGTEGRTGHLREGSGGVDREGLHSGRPGLRRVDETPRRLGGDIRNGASRGEGRVIDRSELTARWIDRKNEDRAPLAHVGEAAHRVTATVKGAPPMVTGNPSEVRERTAAFAMRYPSTVPALESTT